MTPILHATGLHTYYGVSHILRGVSLDLAKGVSLGLLGRNGSGKSTLLKVLNGEIPVAGGTLKGAMAWARRR